MTRYISFISARRGSGVSTILHQTALALANKGKRIGIIDANYASPSQHFLFGRSQVPPKKAFPNVLQSDEDIHDSVLSIKLDYTPQQLFLLPFGDAASSKAWQKVDENKLYALLQKFASTYLLDYILIDSPAGLSQFTLAIITYSTASVVSLLYDKQMLYQTHVLAQLCKSLQVPHWVAVNDVLPSNQAVVQDFIEKQFGKPPIAVIPHKESSYEINMPNKPLNGRKKESVFDKIAEQLEQIEN